MLYSIDGIENILDLMVYTVSAMKEVGYGDCDVDDYIEEAIKSNNYDIIILSKEKLNDCNILSNEVRSNNDLFEDTWCNHYCSSFWDDDGRYNRDDEDEIDTYDYMTGCKKTNNDNMTDDEAEAYEGFSSCNNHYWDSSEDDYEDESDLKIRNYYDSMREEFDPSYDEHCGQWYDENDDK